MRPSSVKALVLALSLTLFTLAATAPPATAAPRTPTTEQIRKDRDDDAYRSPVRRMNRLIRRIVASIVVTEQPVMPNP